MRLRVALRDLVAGQVIATHNALLFRRVGPGDGAVVLDALDVSRQVGEDGYLARASVGGVGALDFGFDAIDGGHVGGVVEAWGVRKGAGTEDAQQRGGHDPAWSKQ